MFCAIVAFVLTTQATSPLGINLNGPADWNSELPFVDLMRFSRPWISQAQGQAWGHGPALQIDSHGWVTSIPDGAWAETVLCTVEGHYPAGKYHVYYSGEGDLTFNHGVAEIVSQKPGELVVQVDPKRGALFMQLRRTNPTNPVRNIHVIMPGCEGTWKTQPFRAGFLDTWRGVKSLRFMDWMNTNGSKQKSWSGRPTSSDASWQEKGIPVEVMCDLANQLNADPWFCMPHLADDDYIRQFATVVKEKLKPNLKVYLEYSNEVWNGQFTQNKYAGDTGLAAGIGNKHWDAAWHYTARRSVQIFGLWEKVFGGHSQLVRVLPSQAANPFVSEQICAFEDAYKHADALAIAPYFGFVAGPQTKPSSDEAAKGTLDQLFAHLEGTVVPEVEKWIQGNKAVADKFGLKLVAYEGGQHLVGIQGGENNHQLEELFHAANRDPRMGALYTRYLNMWQRNGGGLFEAFSSVGSWSKWGSWGAMEYFDDNPAKSPKYQALKAWGKLSK